MKTLDRKASEILRGLLALQKSKIDNTDGAYMPVHIEIIDRTEDYDHISLAHYGQQNGDAMRDPEMILGMEQYSVRWTEEGVLLNRRLQADHTTFANRWLRNIATQQHLL